MSDTPLSMDDNGPLSPLAEDDDWGGPDDERPLTEDHDPPSDIPSQRPAPSPLTEDVTPTACCAGRSCWERTKAYFWRELHFVLTLCGVVLGISVGLLLRLSAPEPDLLAVLGLPGDLFLRALKMLILPLVMGSVIGGVCGLRVEGPEMAVIAREAFLYYFLTTTLAVILGIVTVSLVSPGMGAHFGAAGCEVEEDDVPFPGQNRTDAEALLHVLHQLLPTNLVVAAAGSNILGILCFSLLFGVTLAQMGTAAEPFLAGVNAFNAVTSRLVHAVLLLSPIGVASLIIDRVATACDVTRLWCAIGQFVFTVLLCLGVHCFVVLPSLFCLVTRSNPLPVYVGFSPALMAAFNTGSSLDALPLTLKCAEENLRVPPALARFVLPLGAIINLDGSALYETIAAIFIAQAHDVPLDLGHRCIIAIVATLVAVGASTIPSTGLVTVIIILQAVGLEEYTSSVAGILIVDWLLERFRTCINVLGDAFGAVILHDLQARHSTTPLQHPEGHVELVSL